MKPIGWLLSSLLILSGCETAPKRVPVLEVCPRVPELELDVPERDWREQMQSFLRGSLPTQADYALPLGSAKLNTTR